MNLRDILGSSIKTYLDADPRRSVASLAKKTNCAYNTIKRLLNAEGGDPDVAVSSKVLLVTDPSARDDILRKHFPDCVSLKKAGSTASGFCLPEKFTSNSTAYAILLAAGRDSGVSCKDVSPLFGEAGVMLAQQMVEAGVLMEDGECLKWAENASLDPDLFAQLISGLANLYTLRQRSQESISWTVAALSEEKRSEFEEIRKRQDLELVEFLSKADNSGNIPVAWGSLSLGLDEVEK